MRTREASLVPSGGGIIPEQWTYIGPGWVEWAFSFAVTALTAGSLNVRLSMGEVMSASRYYSQVEGVMLLHNLALVVNALFLVTIATWIFLSRRQVPFGWVPQALAVIGAALAWTELMIARGTQPNSVYLLESLPIRPINNLGIIGAQVFLTYLIFKSPSGSLKTWPSLVVKSALALCLWLFQLCAWDILARGM